MKYKEILFSNKLLGFLNTLFLWEGSREERKQVLSGEYGLKWNVEMEKEIDSMTGIEANMDTPSSILLKHYMYGDNIYFADVLNSVKEVELGSPII